MDTPDISEQEDDLRRQLDAAWGIHKAVRAKLLDRDRYLSKVLRAHFSATARALLQSLGEHITLSVSDRLLDVASSVTMMDVEFSQDDHRSYRFAPLHIAVQIKESSVHFDGGPGWDREATYCLPMFNEIVARHYAPTNAIVVGAFDPEVRRR